MNKIFTTIIFLIVFIFICAGILTFEKNQLTMVDIKVNELYNEYKEIEAETDENWYKINSILERKKLKKIAEEKNFSKPDDSRIVIIGK